MAAKTVRVRARISRYIGDDYYGVGNTYRMAVERAERYTARGDFEYVDDPPSEPEPADEPAETEEHEHEKQSDPPANKMRAAADNKAR